MDGKKMMKSVVLGGFLLGSCLFGVKVQAAADEVTGDFLSKDLDLSPSKELYWAVFYGDLTVVRELLDEKVMDVNAVFPGGEVYRNNTDIDTTLLETAIYRGEDEIVKLLVEHGADPNQRRLNRFGAIASPLQSAICFARPNIVKILLENGADPHQRYRYNNTLLHEAMINFIPSNRWLDAVTLLLDQGLDPNDRNDYGHVPLTLLVLEILTATRNHFFLFDCPSCDPGGGCIESAEAVLRDINYMLEMIELFIRHGANINMRDNDGYTLMHWAIMPPRRYFNEKNSDDSDDSDDSDNILCKYKHLNLKLLKKLIKLGADVNIEDNDWMTPLDMFLPRKEIMKNEYDQEAIILLRKHGATEGYPKNETESQPQDEDAVEDKIEDKSEGETESQSQDEDAVENKIEEESEGETESQSQDEDEAENKIEEESKGENKAKVDEKTEDNGVEKESKGENKAKVDEKTEDNGVEEESEGENKAEDDEKCGFIKENGIREWRMKGRLKYPKAYPLLPNRNKVDFSRVH
jgi:ankyrin repeat protein